MEFRSNLTNYMKAFSVDSLEPYYNVPYTELINEQKEKGRSYVLAVMEDDRTSSLHSIDADYLKTFHEINKKTSKFTNCSVSKNNDQSLAEYENTLNQKKFKYQKTNPITGNVIKNIFYYVLDVSKISYICSYQNTVSAKDQNRYSKLCLAAELGHHTALTTLGNCCLLGLGEKQNVEKAAQLFKNGAAFGNDQAMNNLGYCYIRGLGVSKDKTIGKNWFNQGFKRGNVASTNNLACSLLSEEVNEKKIKGALELFHRVVDRGNSQGIKNLASLKFWGLCTIRDVSQAKRILSLGVKGGKGSAMRYTKLSQSEAHDLRTVQEFKRSRMNKVEKQLTLTKEELVFCKNLHLGIEFDEKIQVKKCQDIVEKKIDVDENKFMKAEFELGFAKWQGLSMPIDIEGAIATLESSAKKGCADAKYALGVIKYKENQTEAQMKESLHLIEEAANQGQCEAQFELAYCKMKGFGTPIDIEGAIKLFTLAADQGYSNAQYHLGNIYNHGNLTAQNLNLALKYYTMASMQYHPGAQNALSNFYMKGIAVRQNFYYGYKLLTLASELGLKEAQYNLALIKLHGYISYSGCISDLEFESVETTHYIADLYKKHGVSSDGYGNFAPHGITSDVNEALRLLQESANQGYDLAIEKLKSFSNK